MFLVEKNICRGYLQPQQDDNDTLATVIHHQKSIHVSHRQTAWSFSSEKNQTSQTKTLNTVPSM